MSATDTIDATADRSAVEGIAEAMENAIDYIGAAGANAGASVKSAAGKTGELIGAGAYKGAYGVSYGVVFAAVFLKELLPVSNSVRRGFEDGAHAAFDAIDARKAPVLATETEEPAEAEFEAPAAKTSSRRKTVKPAEVETEA